MACTVCEGCVFYHPRRKKPCSALPRAVPEEMKACDCRLEVPPAEMLRRTVLPEEVAEARKK